MTDKPERQQLSGYVMRNYREAIAALGEAREQQGLSLRQVADRTGMGHGTLSDALRGVHGLEAFNLFALAHALGYDLAFVSREDA